MHHRPFAAVLCSMLLLASRAAGDGGSGAVVHVVAPGNEALIGEMVGVGGALPSGCSVQGVSIDRSRIVARYACGAASPVVELLHPSDPAAAGAAATTARFAVVAGDAPAPLVEAIVQRVSAREASFRWTSIEAPRQAHGGEPGGVMSLAGPPPPHRFFVAPGTFAAGALAIAAAATLLSLLGRRPRAASGSGAPSGGGRP